MSENSAAEIPDDSADANEGLVGDALRRLAFGRPAVHSRLIRAATRGAADAPIEDGKHYVTITLAQQSLSTGRVFTSRFRPVFYAQAAFAQDRNRPVRMAALAADPKDVGGEGPAKLTSEGVVAGDRPLFGQTPWRGRMETQFSLLACRSEAILRALLPLGEDLKKSLGASNGAAALGSLIPGSIALDLASAAAKALTRMDGQWTARCEHAGALQDLETGHYVLLALRNDAEAPPQLEYDADANILYANGRKVQGRDYAVLRVDASTRRENIADLPDLGRAFEDIDLVFASGGNVGPALEKFRRLAQISPHLTEADRADLIQRVVQRTTSLSVSIVNRADRNESAYESVVQSRALPGLADLWSGPARRAPTPPVPAAAPETAAQTSTPPKAAAPTTLRQPQSRFDTALKFTLDWEGGYSDHPNDQGGRTMKGVREEAYHAWLKDQGDAPRPVQQSTAEERYEIYRQNFWVGARCNDLPANVDICQFDAAVNHSPYGAARLLQRAINASLQQIGSQSRIPEDGSPGPETLRQAQRIDAAVLAKAYIAARRELYARIVEKKPNQNAFLPGWLNRVAELERSIAGAGAAAAASPSASADTAYAGFVE